MSRRLTTPCVHRVFLYSSCIVMLLALFMIFMATPLFNAVQSHPVGNLVLKIIGGAIGTLGAIAGLIIWFGMLWFWAREDQSPASRKVIWLVPFFLLACFGSAVYFFAVYVKQVRERAPTSVQG